MTQRIKINTKVLLSYIHNSNTPIELIRKKLPNIDKFLSGDLEPTFNQLSVLSKLINVPTGLLVLKEKIIPISLDVDFRTLNSQRISEMSSELKATILEMQEKQEFLRDAVEDECYFVGMFDFNSKLEEVIEKARTLLGPEITQNRFRYYRKVLGKLGIYIFLNGKYKDNTHRPLNVKEFRGFVLSDKKAPIIFINQLDSKAGQLFTLIHEFIHVLFGDSDLLEPEEVGKQNKKEAVINSVTAEILAPKSLIIDMFDGEKTIKDNLEIIAKKTEVSKFVILRRLYDFSIISKDTYQSINFELEEEFNQIQKHRKPSSGGNYSNNLRFRIDNNFFKYVNNAVQQNKITYTDAFNIVGVGYKGYKILSKGEG
ncbi:peptidase [Streptococcus pneumoniae]|nr:ImmA/IrrE family metallo-endopeptidase [Streptococcus pneumoniae]VKQ77192.1 peptidase [Streptococcus pneumoniae]VKU06224.1 peptidase [Streptococcus pneumoniae]VMD80442.1 peptidase [Streptococcus pneumoniae]VRB74286.1 peptidase [Streptococcus pneumoniae]